jgi:hypothetical protein
VLCYNTETSRTTVFGVRLFVVREGGFQLRVWIKVCLQ